MSSENIVFTAVPMEGSPFEHLISGGGGGGSSSNSDKRQERLRLALQIAIVVLGITALGLILGFSIAAIKHRHHHHHHNKHHHDMATMSSQRLPQHEEPVLAAVESVPEPTKTHSDPSFWGVKRTHEPPTSHGEEQILRPKRRHSPYANKGTAHTKGFWKPSSTTTHDAPLQQLRHHERPVSMMHDDTHGKDMTPPKAEAAVVEERDYDDFFPTDDDEFEEMQLVDTMKAIGGRDPDLN